MKELGGILVINGSFFTRYGTPATPVVSARVPSGRPTTTPGTALSWPRPPSWASGPCRYELADALEDADHGLVFLSPADRGDGRSRSKGDARWLANRSFIAQDEIGHIVLGTTKDAFFSLDRLAAFLREAPVRR